MFVYALWRMQTLKTDTHEYQYPALGDVSHLPYSIRILIENLLRNGEEEKAELIKKNWGDPTLHDQEIPFSPARVLLQDFTGVPAIVDLAAMRDAIHALGGNPKRINPLVPVDLVIDHSVQVDASGSENALAINMQREFERNRERYEFLRWGQKAFDYFRVVPPGAGIVHQVNLEYLASVVSTKDGWIFPDTLVGTDSHTTMINGLGVLGWGVGGIEAEAAMLGQPISILLPRVVGVRLDGTLKEGVTATDLVLTVTERLRTHGVVEQFVEFFGPAVAHLTLADRATIANMAPEYGATIGYFPPDAETIRYLVNTGRDIEQVHLAERYLRRQGLFVEGEKSEKGQKGEHLQYSEILTINLSDIEPSVAGPMRPQDRVALKDVKKVFQAFLESSSPSVILRRPNGPTKDLEDGSVLIAAITSCTNTSNPSVMLAAGLLARNAVKRGMRVPSYVKTSLAPGSKVVKTYLERAGLLSEMETLGFHIVGFGCTTCIAEGTPILATNGTSHRIEKLPIKGGVHLFGPTANGKLGKAFQSEMMIQGERECITLIMQDGRELICTPDHEILCADGRWVRAENLKLGKDRVMMGLEGPIDDSDKNENGYKLPTDQMRFSMETYQERLRTLAFARLLGHLLSDGSISCAGQGRMNVGQALDRETVLDDIELLTGKRPAGSRYDERKWSIALPKELTRTIISLPGVCIGKRINQPPTLPRFILSPHCPISVVREFLGGLFGADGHGPTLHRYGNGEHDASLETPAYSQSTIPVYKEAARKKMQDILALLIRCGVKTEGTKIYEYPVRRASSSYPTAKDEPPRIEIRLVLPDGLSFIERIGFRYCVDKALRASTAAVYWRMVGTIKQQRLWMASRLKELHQSQPSISFSRVRAMAAAEFEAKNTVIFPHYSLLEGHDRFTRLPSMHAYTFRPLHRQDCGFPSPSELFEELGVRDWFAAVPIENNVKNNKRYCLEKDALALPTFSLKVVDRRPVGKRKVFDLAVDDLHAFVAGGVCVHNCIGNSGPIDESYTKIVEEQKLITASVLSGNRNFEGRVHPLTRANFLASPPLVVAYALAGTVDIDLTTEPLGHDANGLPIFLYDLWPSAQEIQSITHKVTKPDLYKTEYTHVFEGTDEWNSLEVPEGDRYQWKDESTYIRLPTFLKNISKHSSPIQPINNARVLAVLGDSITTDHISPAGNISKNGPTADYLRAHAVEPRDFNSYGARRGNHEVMMRGTFANVRLKNLLATDTEGSVTVHIPSGEQMSIFEVAERYRNDGTPLIVIAGKDYGMGSSRDWAAKGPALLGVRAVIFESVERIHRSNLIGMGILPLQFLDGQNRTTLGLTGLETFAIPIDDQLKPGKKITITTFNDDGSQKTFETLCRLDSIVELDYFRHGGILPYVLRGLL